MSKKLWTSVIISLLVVFMLSSATLGFFGFFGSESDDDTIRIGFLLKTMQEERYITDRAAFSDKVEELGAELVFDAANNNEMEQVNKFENMLAQGVDVIVLQPVNTGTAGNMVQMAHEEGVRVVGYDSLLVDGPLDAHVMQDSWAVGQLQGEAMIDWFKEHRGEVKGRVAMIKGQPGDSNAIAMSEGALEIIHSEPGLELVAEEWHEGWSPDRSMATAENVLTSYNNEVDAFISNNSGMARGVISALEGQGLADASKVFVAGSDADLPNMRYVEQGIQAVDIFKKIVPLAERAAEVAYKLAINPDSDVLELVEADRMIDNNYQEVPTIITPVVPVYQDNLRETVIEAGFHSEEDIFGN